MPDQSDYDRIATEELLAKTPATPLTVKEIIRRNLVLPTSIPEDVVRDLNEAGYVIVNAAYWAQAQARDSEWDDVQSTIEELRSEIRSLAAEVSSLLKEV